MLIWLEIAGLKKPGSHTLWICLGEANEGGVWFSVCGAPLVHDWANGSFWCLSLGGVGPILGNGYGIFRQNYVALPQGSEISVRLFSRNFILGL